MDDDDRILRRLLDLEHRLKALDKDGNLDTSALEASIRRSFNLVYKDIDELGKRIDDKDRIFGIMQDDLRGIKKTEKEVIAVGSGVLAHDIECVRVDVKRWSDSLDGRFSTLQALLLKETTAIGGLFAALAAEQQKRATRTRWALIFLIVLNGVTLIEIIKMRNGIP